MTRSLLRRLRFLIRMLLLTWHSTDESCPYCGEKNGAIEGRKYWLLKMKKCGACGLLYRVPRDTPAFNQQYFQATYQKGITTDVPTADELKRLVAANFSGTIKDYSGMIQKLNQLLHAGRVLDYGCSWGYTVHQLQKAGYEAYGFELSAPRATYGRDQMGLKIWEHVADLDQLPEGYFDAIVTAHVLQHLPDLHQVFERFHRLLKPGGFLGIWLPNGGSLKAQEMGVYWGPMISEEHLLVFTASFFRHALPEKGFAPLCVADAERFAAWDSSRPTLIERPTGDELVIIASRAR